MIKHSLFDEDIKQKFDDLPFRTDLKRLLISSAWPIAILGMVELLFKLGESKDCKEMLKLLFDELWLDDIREVYDTTKKKIEKYAAKISKENQKSQNISTNDMSKEYIQNIDKMYSEVIEVEPYFVDEERRISPHLVEDKFKSRLKSISERMDEFKVKRICNFSIILMAKGIQCFMKSCLDDQDEYKIDTKIVVIYEANENNYKKSEYKKKFKEAESF